MSISYVNSISVADYNYLRRAVGWNEIEAEQALRGIQNSAFLVAAVTKDQTVGLSRVVSDRGYIALIVDVIVMPEYQGIGIGRGLMTHVMSYIENSIGKGQQVYINLMAAKGKEKFYTQFGFECKPNDLEGPGMTQRIYKEY